MGLIPDARHKRRDLARWRTLEAADQRIAASATLARHESRAMRELEAFARQHEGDVYAGTSWGKDSTVIAHLIHRLKEEQGLCVPLVYVRVQHTENPLSPKVRDAFLERFGGVDYHEVLAPQLHPGGSSVLGGDVPAQQSGFAITRRRFGRAHVSGVRADESGVRKLRMRKDGERSRWSCRPIGWWSHVYVFAYLAKFDLPIHPAYAMSYGGTLERQRIRVSALAGRRCVEFGREDWDRFYFREEMLVIDQIKKAHRDGEVPCK